MVLQDRHVVLGVSGSIAAYKAVEVASRLVQAGAKVDAVLTSAAQEFVKPLTFGSLTGRPVFTDMFNPATDMPEEHVAIARLADLVVIAPASATTIARLAHGLADDFLSLTCLASKAPLLLAPAMDSQMWEAAATQENVGTLRRRGVALVGPDSGRLASGHQGSGRLSAPEIIVEAAKFELAKQGDFAGRRLVISAGGTREPLDPVRFIGNRSSGKMGYALAEAARDRGASVSLVSAASDLPAPYEVELILTETVAEMRNAVLEACDQADGLIMTAAVSDFRPTQQSIQKIKSDEGEPSIALQKTEKILMEVPEGIIKVGFAAETEDLLSNARKKLRDYRLDLICANDITDPAAGFAVDTNKVTILEKDGGERELPLMTKYAVAHEILDRVATLLIDET